MSNANLIRNSIFNIVHSHIEQNSLKEQLIEYIDYHSKQGFPFGELLLLHYNMFEGVQNEEIYTVAAGIEILILSADIFDDLEDDDSANKPWSSKKNLALNGATALLVISANVIRSTNFHNKDKSISILFKYALQSINGQHSDLLNICRNEADYIEMTLEKSGSLVALACLIGTVLATNRYLKEVKIYAKLIGLIAQINNDLLDISTWNDKNDLIHRKYTLPIIYLLNCKDEKLHFINEYYDEKIDVSELLKRQAFIDKKIVETGAIAYTKVIKKVYQNKILTEVKKLNITKEHLNQLIHFIN